MCSSCAAKQQLAGNQLAKSYTSEVTGPCIYEFTQISQLLTYNLDSLDRSIVISALNFYEKNCNKFSTNIGQIILKYT